MFLSVYQQACHDDETEKSELFFGGPLAAYVLVALDTAFHRIKPLQCGIVKVSVFRSQAKFPYGATEFAVEFTIVFIQDH